MITWHHSWRINPQRYGSNLKLWAEHEFREWMNVRALRGHIAINQAELIVQSFITATHSAHPKKLLRSTLEAHRISACLSDRNIQKINRKAKKIWCFVSVFSL